MTARDFSTLEHWLSIDSTTGREAAYVDALDAALQAEGLTVERQPVAPGRDNLFAHAGEPVRFLLNTHTDTVPPFFGPRWDGDKLRARGACDTKGGLFAMLEAWRALSEDERRAFGFSLVVGEEVDHIGAIAAATQAYPGLEAIVMCEPTQNRLSRGQKGILKVRLHCDGVAGHSAFPEAGDSAVHRLIDACHALQHAAWPTDELLGPTTLNIGVIAGGVAANVFAPSANAEVLFRVVSDLDALRAQVHATVGDAVRVEEIAANDAIRLQTWPGFATDVVPFNTDAPYLGVHAPVVLVGPGDIRTAHSPDEHLTRAAFEAGVALYIDLFRGLVDGTYAPDAHLVLSRT